MKTFKGTFEVIDGKLSFTCITEGVTFPEVEHGLRLLHDEIHRQIKEQKNCPYHGTKEIVSRMHPRDPEKFGPTY